MKNKLELSLICTIFILMSTTSGLVKADSAQVKHSGFSVDLYKSSSNGPLDPPNGRPAITKSRRSNHASSVAKSIRIRKIPVVVNSNTEDCIANLHNDVKYAPVDPPNAYEYPVVEDNFFTSRDFMLLMIISCSMIFGYLSCWNYLSSSRRRGVYLSGVISTTLSSYAFETQSPAEIEDSSDQKSEEKKEEKK